MGIADETPTATVISRAVGRELRLARDTAGLTREQAVEQLPYRLHTQTLAAYERGTIQLMVPRLVDLCRPLTVAPPDVLSLALQRAQIDLRIIGLHIDLHAVARDKTPGTELLRQWAHNRLADTDPSGVTHLPWVAVQELAAAFGFTHAALTTHLLKFTPKPLV